MTYSPPRSSESMYTTTLFPIGDLVSPLRRSAPHTPPPPIHGDLPPLFLYRYLLAPSCDKKRGDRGLRGTTTGVIDTYLHMYIYTYLPLYQQ